MKLSKTVTLQPSSYIDENDKVVKPLRKTFDQLNITYCDSPFQRKYYIHIAELEENGILFLFEDDIYDAVQPINKNLADMHLESLMKDDPQSFLQGLYPRTLADDPNGPGSILSDMLKMIGIKSTENCSCRRHAVEMNLRGPDWCENNLETIISWLKIESANRKLPFIETAAKLLVKRAISRSRKLISKEEQKYEQQIV